MQAQDDRRRARLELARQWRDSGAKARAFAQEHGVTPWTLYYWRKRLTQQEPPASRRRRTRQVKLAPVQIVASDGSDDLEIQLAGGDRVRVRAGVSTEALQRVIHALRTAC